MCVGGANKSSNSQWKSIIKQQASGKLKVFETSEREKQRSDSEWGGLMRSVRVEDEECTSATEENRLDFFMFFNSSTSVCGIKHKTV